MQSIPLLKFHQPESVFAWQGGKTISAQRFLTDVIALAERLPARSYVLNLCNDRYRFMVGFSAAMLRGQISLLPPSHTSDLVNRLAQQYADLYCLSDAAHGHGSLQTMPYPDLSAVNLLQVPLPEIPAAQVAALVFTSGSTGNPMPHEKTWGCLITRRYRRGQPTGHTQSRRPDAVRYSAAAAHVWI